MFLSPGPVDHPCNRTMGIGRAADAVEYLGTPAEVRMTVRKLIGLWRMGRQTGNMTL